MRHAGLAAIALFALSFVLPMRADTPTPSCKLIRKAALDMTMDDTGRITVPVTFNGTKQEMMVDTGASETILTAHAVEALHLTPHEAPNRVYMQGFGGRIIRSVVDVAEFGFGGMKGKNFQFFVDSQEMETAGLLGADFLYFFDVDFDFAAAKLNLMSPDHCPGKVTYWTRDTYGIVPFEIDDNHIVVNVKLDGEDVSAILDTGAADTVMSLERASFVYDLDHEKLAKSRHYPFKTLSFGSVSVNNPAIQLMPDRESGVMGRGRSSLHMIVGMGVLRRLHLYISYKEKTIYVTPATQH